MATCGRSWIFGTVLLIAIAANLANGQDGSGTLIHNFNVSGFSVTLEFSLNNTEHIVTGHKVYVNFNVSVAAGDSAVTAGGDESGEIVVIKLQIRHPDIARITNASSTFLKLASGTGVEHHSFEIVGVFLGRTWIDLSYGVMMSRNHSASGVGPALIEDPDFRVHLSVIRVDRAIDKIFISVVALLVVLANVGMGCKVDLEVVKEVLKKPFAPAIGFTCQYLLMPVLAFAFTEMLKLQGGQALGFFAAGCAPGGGASNIYTYLLAGDISLSITMTLLSTIGSLAFIPFWIFTLGRVILDQYHVEINIPYTNIFISLISILIPVGVGILIQKKRPTWAKQITKIIRPLGLVFIIFVMTFGVYTNLYMFKLFTPPMILAGALLPYAGFFIGGLVAFLFKQPWVRVKTIAIETGIQNTGIPILLMKFSLPQPDADLSIVSPIAVATFTPIPLLIAIISYEIQKRCCKDKKRLDMLAEDEEEDNEMTNGHDMGDDNARLHSKDSKYLEGNGRPT